MTSQQQGYLTGKQWAVIIQKAWEEPEFKAQLEADPRAAIEEHFPDWAGDCLLKVPMPPHLEDDSAESVMMMPYSSV